MKYSKYLDIFDQQDGMRNFSSERKVKKFFRIALPILIVEIFAALVLGIYLLLLPKNYCNFTTNTADAVIYIDNKKATKFRFDHPKDDGPYYYYEIDVKILLPEKDVYSVSYTMHCNKYEVFASTSGTLENSVYTIQQVKGGEKTQLFTGVTIKSNTKIDNFNVTVNVIVTKI